MRVGGGGGGGGAAKKRDRNRATATRSRKNQQRSLDLKVIVLTLNHSERKLYHFYVVYCLVAAPVVLDCFKTLAAQVVARLVDV